MVRKIIQYVNVPHYDFFWMWIIIKLFICFMFCFFGMWDTSSLMSSQAHTPCIGTQSLNIMEVPEST